MKILSEEYIKKLQERDAMVADLYKKRDDIVNKIDELNSLSDPFYDSMDKTPFEAFITMVNQYCGVDSVDTLVHINLSEYPPNLFEYGYKSQQLLDWQLHITGLMIAEQIVFDKDYEKLFSIYPIGILYQAFCKYFSIKTDVLELRQMFLDKECEDDDEEE